MPRSTVISRLKQTASVFLDFMAHSCVGHANSQFSTLLFATVRFTARFKNMWTARENSQQNDRSNTITRSVFLSMNCTENWIKNCYCCSLYFPGCLRHLRVPFIVQFLPLTRTDVTNRCLDSLEGRGEDLAIKISRSNLNPLTTAHFGTHRSYHTAGIVLRCAPRTANFWVGMHNI